MSRGRLRKIAEPFVVAPPAGRRIRTRILVAEGEHDLLWQVGMHLARLAGRDLAERCRIGQGDGKDRTQRARRKQALTGEASSRWAGAVTRTSNDQWQRAYDNLLDRRVGLQSAIETLERRCAAPTRDVTADGDKTDGYATQTERAQKLVRLDHKRGLLVEVCRRIAAGHVSVTRGGRRLLGNRAHLDAAGMSESQWRERWAAERLFLTADGEADKVWGNETIRVTPDGELSIRLPTPLAHLANARKCRYVFAKPVRFSYRYDEWDTQIRGGAVRYDITYDPDRDRWYLDASWTFETPDVPTVAGICAAGILGIDANGGFVACWRLDGHGNPVGAPTTIATVAADASSGTRDGQLRAAVTAILDLAQRNGLGAVAIENLNFTAAASREGKHSRGHRGRNMRRLLAGFPTAKFRDRLVQMAANRGMWVVSVDPAYTSKWGAQHWRKPLATPLKKISRHDAAAIVIGRRALGYHARRRPGKPRPAPADADGRTTGQAAHDRRPREGTRTGRGNAPPNASRRPNRQSADQEPQHRSAAPTKRNSLSLSV